MNVFHRYLLVFSVGISLLLAADVLGQKVGGECKKGCKMLTILIRDVAKGLETTNQAYYVLSKETAKVEFCSLSFTAEIDGNTVWSQKPTGGKCEKNNKLNYRVWQCRAKPTCTLSPQEGTYLENIKELEKRPIFECKGASSPKK